MNYMLYNIFWIFCLLLYGKSCNFVGLFCKIEGILWLKNVK